MGQLEMNFLLFLCDSIYRMKSLSGWQCLIIDSLEFFANLAQTHRCVGEYLVFWNLFLDNLCKYYLEREAESTLL